jgi:hypothetical protein
MSSKCIELEGSSSGRRLYVQVWCNFSICQRYKQYCRWNSASCYGPLKQNLQGSEAAVGIHLFPSTRDLTGMDRVKETDHLPNPLSMFSQKQSAGIIRIQTQPHEKAGELTKEICQHPHKITYHRIRSTIST